MGASPAAAGGKGEMKRGRMSERRGRGKEEERGIERKKNRD